MASTHITIAKQKVAMAARIRQLHRFLNVDPEKLAEHQLSSLGRILDAAMRSEPYRRLYGTHPRIEQLEDLKTLPVIDRRYLGEFPVEQRLTEQHDDLEEEPSTGTSGEVMMTLRTTDETRYLDALLGRQLFAQGIAPGARRLNLLVGMTDSDPLEVRGHLSSISAWAPVERQAEAARSFDPSFISGPPSSLIELGNATGGIQVDALMTFGEVVTDLDRRELRSLYGTDPLDQYVSSEAGQIAWECTSRSGYHVNADAVLLEVLDDDDEPTAVGEAGHLVITTLWNPTMPVIRYRVGDIGRLLPGPCPCGISLPLLDAVEGRDTDRPVAHDGRRVSAMRLVLGNVGPYFSDVARFRVIQRDVDHIVVEIAWRNEPIPDLAKKMAETYSRALGGPVNVELREVETFSKPRGRKFRWVESLVR